jgi:hypothetical protein
MFGPFRDIRLNRVTVGPGRGVLDKVSLGDATAYEWKMQAIFYRFDGDTLTGRMLAQLVATQAKVRAKLELEKDAGRLLNKWG